MTMTVFISDSSAQLLSAALSDESFTADSSVKNKANNVAHFLRNTTQSVTLLRQRMPEWAMCFVSGEMSNCRVYSLHNSDDVVADSIQSLQPKLATSGDLEFSHIAGRLVGYSLSMFAGFESAYTGGDAQISSGLQTQSLISAPALSSLKDVIDTVQKTSDGSLVMGFVSPELLFFSIEELLSRCERFPTFTPQQLLKNDGLPGGLVHITLRDSAGQTKEFFYPAIFESETNEAQHTQDAHTVEAIIRPGLVDGTECTLTGDQWRSLDGNVGALATFVARYYLDLESPDDLLDALSNG